jgi:DNA processing protein
VPKREASGAGGRAAPLPVAELGDAERLACLRLIRTENVGPVAFRELINQCGGAEQALAALPDLSRRGGRRQPVKIHPRGEAEAELAAARALGVQALFTIEPGYPAALVHAGVPPPLIYVKGRVELLAQAMVAIVGSRNASAAGREMARQLAIGLSAGGLVVVSGLARGIDGAAHEAALAAKGGTVAVMAGGIDHIYPPEHASLHARIGAEGCIVSEQAPGFRARGNDFPRRNRIISGLSMGVVIVEAATRSGSLITARMAAEQGREVFAVPGHPLDPRAEGTNKLLKGGATIATSAADILEALAPQLGRDAHGLGERAEPRSPASDGDDDEREMAAAVDMYAVPGASRSDAIGLDVGGSISGPPEAMQAAVLAALGPAPLSIDALARATGLPMRALQGALLELTLAARIERHGAQLVSLRTATD